MAEFPAVDARTMSSLPAMFFIQAEKLGDRNFLWVKKGETYTPCTWREAAAQVSALGHGLKAAGVRPGDRVMLVSENRPEWLIADVAVMSIGAVAVPTYTTNTAANHLHIINDSGARIALVSTAQLAKP